MIAMMPNKIDKVNYGQLNFLEWLLLNSLNLLIHYLLLKLNLS